jgi:glycosyltransferase involved in cell wall biosynthesis
MKKVSIIVPLFNEEKNLDALCDALRKQTYCDFEVILIDNGSVDNTFELAKKWINLPRFKIYRCDEAGSYAARNLGIINSSGEFILFTDGDCVPDKKWAEKMVQKFNVGYDVVAGYTQNYEVKRNPIYNYMVQEFATAQLSESVVNGRSCIFPTCNVGYRRNVFIENGYFPNISGGDVIFSSQAYKEQFRCGIELDAVVRHYFSHSIWDIAGRYFRYGAAMKVTIKNIFTCICILLMFPLNLFLALLYSLLNFDPDSKWEVYFASAIKQNLMIAGAIKHSIFGSKRVF